MEGAQRRMLIALQSMGRSGSAHAQLLTRCALGGMSSTHGRCLIPALSSLLECSTIAMSTSQHRGILLLLSVIIALVKSVFGFRHWRLIECIPMPTLCSCCTHQGLRRWGNFT
uniref:Uncharacterized protein n=1 Tax=Arundo donax TaxID=35708 RepID=A0A0A9DPU5_ARUDO